MFAVIPNFRVANAVLRNYVRGIQSNDSLLDECQGVRNRNPRNLEFLRIARKPDGWSLEKEGRKFWHKLVLKKNNRYVSLELHHFENGPVITVTTKEWAMKRQLYKPTDTAAYKNLGRLMAERCLESGITVMESMTSITENTKINLLLQELTDNGIILREPSVFLTPTPWQKIKQEKSWEIVP